MIGGFMKTTSRIALATVASTIAMSATAFAADLGGNCCADLEERVAELEATTARKGNRKVSLTVYGQVNEAVLFWNDGQESNQYVVSNNSSRSRFGFRGEAKINNDVTAGYLIEIGVRYASSQGRNQTASGAGGGNNANPAGISAPGPLDIRHSAWFLDSKHLGRVWVGKTASASEGITEINLANINTSVLDISNWNGGFFLRNNGTLRSGLTFGNLNSQWAPNVGEGDRVNLVRYISPAFAGFTASASWGEDDRKDIALRYAGEFNGVRLAAGIGYQKMTDFNSTADGGAGCANPGGAPGNAVPGALIATPVISNTSCEAIGLSASAMHVPTGIFLTGSYGQSKDKNLGALGAANVSLISTLGTFVAAPYTGGIDDKNSHWSIQGGIEQKWFSLGKSTLYGEYIKQDTGNGIIGGAGGTGQLRAVSGSDALLLAGNGCAVTATAAANCFLGSSQVKTWGIGFNQAIDNAAADWYVAFRNTSASLNVVRANGTAVPNTGAKDFQAVMTGMIIRF
jgi:predicted porin